MHSDKLNIENDDIEENGNNINDVALNLPVNTLKGTSAINSNEFMNMNNANSAKSKKFNDKMINGQKKKAIFSFGKEDPELLNRYGHLLSVRKYIHLTNELSSKESFYAFPANNPFLLSVSEYEETMSKLNFANVPDATIDIYSAFDTKFLEELNDIVSIAFEVSKKEPSKDELKKRDNSIKVVILLAIINTCGNVDMREYLASEAMKSVAFMIVLDTVCELIDHLRSKVTHAF